MDLKLGRSFGLEIVSRFLPWVMNPELANCLSAYASKKVGASGGFQDDIEEAYLVQTTRGLAPQPTCFDLYLVYSDESWGTGTDVEKEIPEIGHLSKPFILRGTVEAAVGENAVV